jgi:hypothetical protein
VVVNVPPSAPPARPVLVEARLDLPLSRWLWLVKWLLAIPHYIVLGLLWIAFLVLTVVAFVSILFTGRYPRAIFDFNVGVLRWSWRVGYYSWAALATDRYPPFTLADVPDYPARLQVDYPARLSRGLVLVKWWLLALPHYVVIMFFVGGTRQVADGAPDWLGVWGSGGLVGVLVIICVVVLLFTGRYPQPLFDFILGMNRWVLRVWAYVALMTDAYPPFRLDLGGHEPDGRLSPAPGTVGTAPPGTVGTAPPGTVGTAPPGTVETAPPAAWTGGRVASVVIGALLGLSGVGLLVGGAGGLWAHLTQRDAAGYLVSPAVDLDTGGYAVRTEPLRFGSADPGWVGPESLVGTVRVRVTGALPARPVFVGIAPNRDVTALLSGVDHVTLTGVEDGNPRYAPERGTAPSARTPEARIWTAQAAGTGTVELTWKARPGTWALVVANADGQPGVRVRADVAATFPSLGWVAAGLLGAGAVLVVAGTLLVAIPVARASSGQGRRGVVGSGPSSGASDAG